MVHFRWVPVMILLSLYFLHPSRPASCQTLLREAAPLSSIQIRKVVTLGDSDGPGFLGEAIDLARRENGEWVATDIFNQTEVKFFSPTGEYLRTIGREGEGPGEYASAWWLQALPAGELAVLDPRMGRITLYSPDLTVRKTINLSVRIRSAVLLGDYGLIVNSWLNGPEQVGLPLHHVDSTGVLVRSFGADPPVGDWENQDKVARTLAPSGPDAVWSGEKTQYSLERWTSTGQRTHYLIREVPWYPPNDRFGLPTDRTQPPDPSILDLYEDSDGLLWVTVRVPGSRWEEGLEEGRDAYGRPSLRISDRDLYYDTMLEVIDPGRGLVLGSTRLPGALLGPSEEGYLFGNSYGAGVVPVVEVWEATIGGG